MIPTLTWTPEGVRFIDQTKLPLEESYVLATTYEQVADVIVTMVVRGAPAIGVSAAYGIALGAISRPRPTPRRVCAGVRKHLRAPGRNPAHGRQSVLGHRPHEDALRERLLSFRRASRRRSRKDSSPKRTPCTKKTSPPARRWARIGGALLPDEGGVLTHCNAGALATCGYGTALGVIRAAVEQGKQHSRLRRRDAAVPAGRAAHGVGADGRRHSHHRDLRQHGRQPHAAGQDPGRGGGRGPHRRQRRHRQQDRHLQRGHPGARARHPVLRGRALVHHRSGHRDGRRDPHRGAPGKRK